MMADLTTCDHALLQYQQTASPATGQQGGNSAVQLQIPPSLQPMVIQLQCIQTSDIQEPADEPLSQRTSISCRRIDARRFTICGIVQMISGIICITSSLVMIFFCSYIEGGSIGIWGGILFIAAGAFGIVHGEMLLKCYMIICFSLSILAAICSFGLIIVSMIWLPHRMCFTDWVLAMYCVSVLTALSEFITSICQALFFCRYLIRMCNDMEIQQTE